MILLLFLINQIYLTNGYYLYQTNEGIIINKNNTEITLKYLEYGNNIIDLAKENFYDEFNKFYDYDRYSLISKNNIISIYYDKYNKEEYDIKVLINTTFINKDEIKLISSISSFNNKIYYDNKCVDDNYKEYTVSTIKKYKQIITKFTKINGSLLLWKLYF
jgi:hypothetical protein